jgi:sec-independent protein translocase protein TatB
MEILGIGPLEIVFVLILALIILGPQGMVENARKAGVWIRKLVRSPLWKDITTAQREVSDLPRKLVREAGLEEVKASLRQTGQDTRQTILDVTRDVRSAGEDQTPPPPDAGIPPVG